MMKNSCRPHGRCIFVSPMAHIRSGLGLGTVYGVPVWWIFSYRGFIWSSTIARDSRKSRKHGNHVKCRESRDFAKMPCFCQNVVVLRFYKNILFLIRIRWSLLREFNTKILFTFPLPLLPKTCALLLTGSISDHDDKILQMKTLHCT